MNQLSSGSTDRLKRLSGLKLLGVGKSVAAPALPKSTNSVVNAGGFFAAAPTCEFAECRGEHFSPGAPVTAAPGIEKMLNNDDALADRCVNERFPPPFLFAFAAANGHERSAGNAGRCRPGSDDWIITG